MESATEVLGAKMLQGYTLKEQQCDNCGMPLMEKGGDLDCVVCPALAKKVKTRLKKDYVLSKNKRACIKKLSPPRKNVCIKYSKRIDNVGWKPIEKLNDNNDSKRLNRPVS
jgi:uncharacterized Zn finger protein (UPF0148 family)